MGTHLVCGSPALWNPDPTDPPGAEPGNLHANRHSSGVPCLGRAGLCTSHAGPASSHEEMLGTKVLSQSSPGRQVVRTFIYSHSGLPLFPSPLQAPRTIPSPDAFSGSDVRHTSFRDAKQTLPSPGPLPPLRFVVQDVQGRSSGMAASAPF